MTLRVFLLCLFTAGSLTTALAQKVDSFSRTSTAAFLNDFEAFMSAGKREASAALVAEFKPRLNAMSPEQQRDVFTVTNAMLQQRMPVAPLFEDYLSALLRVPFDKKGAQTFADWHKALAEIIGAIDGRRFTNYSTFLDFSKSFFGTGALRDGGSVAWYARSNRFALTIVGGEPVLTFDTVRLVGARRSDSISIDGTFGKYYPVQNRFVGERGRAYWDSARAYRCIRHV